MDTEHFIQNNWYSAQYENGFNIIFQVIDIKDGSMTLCRKDGVLVDTLPTGYSQIIPHGSSEPDYK